MYKFDYTINESYYNKAVKVVITLNHYPDCILDAYYNGPFGLPPSTYVGIATYKDGDLFNKDLAFKVAERKAVRAMYSAFMNYEKQAQEYYEKRAAEHENLRAALSNKKLHITSSIKYLTKNG